MATLVSPGVSISVSDESFYAPAGAGTVPLIVIATAQDKTAPDGTSTADYTTSAKANKLYQITSQRELLQNYGNPNFNVSSGTPLHGDELNEYGLMAAYSFLGISNRAYVLRADIDLDQLKSSASAPAGAPAAGTYWLDPDTTVWGMKKWDNANSKWVSESANVKIALSTDLQSSGTPKSSFGKNDEICVRYFDADGTEADSIKFYQKNSGTWYHIGSSAWQSATSKDFQTAIHTKIPTARSNGSNRVDGDLFLQLNAPNNGSSVDMSRYDSGQFVADGVVVRDRSAIARYNYETLQGNYAKGDLWGDVEGETIDNGTPVATITLKAYNGKSTVEVESNAVVGAVANAVNNASGVAFSIRSNCSAQAGRIDVYSTSSTDGNISVDDLVTDIQSALSSSNSTISYSDEISASNNAGKVKLVNTKGNELQILPGNTSFAVSAFNLTAGKYNNWDDISYEVQSAAPTGAVANATLWYDSDISEDNIDFMVNNGSVWVTYADDWNTAASEPTKQSDGTTALSGGELWINTSDLENVRIYKHDGTKWNIIDLTDQSSEEGILFADCRKDATSSVDADQPNPVNFPTGMLLWNTRASGGGVRQYIKDHSADGTVIGDRWVNYVGTQSNGSPYLLRKAQRKAVVRQLQAAIVANDDIRNETNRFNLVAAPGYPELADEMLALSVDRKDTVFALIDPPFRLKADASSVKNWANNSGNAVENGEDGLLSGSSQAAVYYPHGLSTNLDGKNVMVPASHMALRTIAYNDQVAFPWFAPAGFQRGLVSNATSVGYLDPKEGEFTPVAVNEGQRDAYYLNKVNPISNFPGRGIAVFGQKTLNASASALDRINVSRLVIYIREQLDDAVKPFLFEPNDSVTRSNAKGVVDRFLSELVSQRGLFDFVTVCDTSNNTPARIDRNELHIDVAIQPVKAVEFIYIPIRIQNTLGQSG